MRRAAFQAREKSRTGFKCDYYFMQINPARWGEIKKLIFSTLKLMLKFSGESFLLQSYKQNKQWTKTKQNHLKPTRESSSAAPVLCTLWGEIHSTTLGQAKPTFPLNTDDKVWMRHRAGTSFPFSAWGEESTPSHLASLCPCNRCSNAALFV